MLSKHLIKTNIIRQLYYFFPPNVISFIWLFLVRLNTIFSLPKLILLSTLNYMKIKKSVKLKNDEIGILLDAHMGDNFITCSLSNVLKRQFKTKIVAITPKKYVDIPKMFSIDKIIVFNDIATYRLTYLSFRFAFLIYNGSLINSEYNFLFSSVDIISIGYGIISL